MLKKVNFLKQHVFRERNGKYGYYDYGKNTLYYLNADNQMQYQVLSLRWLTGVILGAAVYLVMNSILGALALACVVIVIMELIFRLRFLPSCKKKEGIRVETLRPCLASGEEQIAPGKRKKRGVLLILLGVLLVANAYDMGLESVELVVSWLVCGACVLGGGVQLLKGLSVQ